ncbi:hypothetical protein BsWGS_17433 [Bradybaena similaris]
MDSAVSVAVVLTAAGLFCQFVDSKRIAGTLLSLSAYGTQEVLLYYDEPGQWDYVYKNGKSCAEKVSVLSTAGNQIMALNTSDAEVSRYSGCLVVIREGSAWYKCQGQRSFRSSRERWWYMAVARCEDSKGHNTGLYLEYKIHMTNGDDLWHREFSADEFYIFPVDISFFVVYLVMTLLSIVCAAVLRSKNLFHTTYKMYLVALFVWTVHLLFMVIAWGCYGNTGLEQGSVEVTGRILQTTSTTIFILMLILMGKGYTITRGRLTKSSAIKIAVFFILYIVVIIALFVWEGMFFDPGKVLYYYESPPGCGMIVMHLIGWLWFLYATAFTIKNAKNKLAFYIPFLGFYTLWFLTGPVVTLVAMFAMPKWSREKTVNGVEQLVAFLGHVFFLALTRPSAANVNFPYHVRTTQISSLPNDKDDVSNPYVISTGVTVSRPGPNLELFTTAKVERPVTDNHGVPMYSSPSPGVSRALETPPPSYPEAVNCGLSLPSAPSWPIQTEHFSQWQDNTLGSCAGGVGLPALYPARASEGSALSGTIYRTSRHLSPLPAHSLHLSPLPGFKV